PDLRVNVPAWIDFDRDRAEALRLADQAASRTAADLAREVFRARPNWSDARVELRTSQVMGGPPRARKEIDGWLAPVVAARGTVVEIGCGTGGLLAALPRGKTAVGLDVSLVWLVVAERLLEQHGRSRPALAAAVAEALPLAERSVGSIVALDVIEHVGDLPQALREIDRVAAPGAALACSTLNRFSLAAEPHVGVWGGGWLPRRWQPTWVRWRTGDEYKYVRLMSAAETARCFSAHTSFMVRAEVPPVPDEEIERFGRRRAWLAGWYNRLHAVTWLRRPFLFVGPFFRIVGRKSEGQRPQRLSL